MDAHPWVAGARSRLRSVHISMRVDCCVVDAFWPMTAYDSIVVWGPTKNYFRTYQCPSQ